MYVQTQNALILQWISFQSLVSSVNVNVLPC